jgi:transposase InsO family protein
LPAQEKGEEFRTPLGEVRQPSQPFQIRHMDLVGPFRVSANKNNYILTFIDKLTKYVEAVPIPDVTAAQCAPEYANRAVARHGAGQTLITYRGASCMTLFFNEVCKILGIRHLNTSAYQPQGNGSVESFHRTLHKFVSHYINASGTNWDTVLPFFIMAYHGCPHSSTAYNAIISCTAEK